MLSLKGEKMQRLTAEIYINYDNVKSSQTRLNLLIVENVDTFV